MQAELGRADFKTMTGLGDRLATQLLTSLLRLGFLTADSPCGKVRFAVPATPCAFTFRHCGRRQSRMRSGCGRRGLGDWLFTTRWSHSASGRQ